MIKRLFLSLLICLLPVTGWAAFPAGWTKRIPITITSTEALTDYQVKVEITFAEGMQIDFDDIRFSADGTTLLDYWREDYTSSTTAVFWVEVPSIIIGNTVIYAYYGNVSAAIEQSFSNTFISGTGFDSGSLGDMESDTANNGSITFVGKVEDMTTARGWQMWKRLSTPAMIATSGYDYVREMSVTRTLDNYPALDGSGDMVAYPTHYKSADDDGAIFRSTSSDGITWSSPTLVFEETGVEIRSGSTIKFDTDDYRMFCQHGLNLAKATSTDNSTWSALSDILTPASFTGASAGIRIPRVTPLSNGVLVLLFESHNGDYVYRIFGATSSDDGDTWTPLNSGNPVLNVGASGEWDSASVANPKLIEISANNYLLEYNGRKQYTFSVGVATSNDLINWTRFAGNPTIGSQEYGSAFYGIETSGIVKTDTFPQSVYNWKQIFSSTHQTGKIIYTEPILVQGSALKTHHTIDAAVIGKSLGSSIDGMVVESHMIQMADCDSAGATRTTILALNDLAAFPGTLANSTEATSRKVAVRRSTSNDTGFPAYYYIFFKTVEGERYWTGSGLATIPTFLSLDAIYGLRVRMYESGTNMVVECEKEDGTPLTTATIAKSLIPISNGYTFWSGEIFNDDYEAQYSFVDYWMVRKLAETEPTYLVGLSEDIPAYGNSGTAIMMGF